MVAAIGERRAAAPGWRALLELCGEAMGLPRHASQHPGGMVIATRPLIDVCPVVPAAMEGRQIVQWDKDSCSDAGFLKIDLLGLGMLSAVERCVDEVGRTRGERLDLSRIDFEDRETFDSIQRAETTGVFQIESRAQMQMLPRTLPASLDDLTVQVALVRPGPIQGGAIHPYIERRQLQREDPDFEIPYDHPLLEEALEETLGTIVYQEQVLEVAKALAGFSSAEAESLRRAMSRKRSAGGDRAPPRALPRRGSGGTASARRRRSASGSRSRASPASASRRRTRPPSACSPTSRPGCGSTAPRSSSARCSTSSRWASIRPTPWSTRRSGAACGWLGPDANRGGVLCRVERERGGLVVRIGLGYVKGVREEEMESLVDARERGGPYRGIADLASRSGAGRDGLERLAWAGALDGIPAGGDGAAPAAARRSGRWGSRRTPRGAGEGTQLALPLEPPEPPPLQPLGGWEAMIADYRSTGMTLDEHPMALMRDGLDPGLLRSTDLDRVEDGSEVEVAGMVVARQRPETAKGIVFMLLEDERGTVNLIVPPSVYERHRAVVRASPLARARGRLERREGVVNVLVSAIDELERRPPADRALRTALGVDKSPLDGQRRRAVAELRAVAPAGHSWGRRGR